MSSGPGITVFNRENDHGRGKPTTYDWEMLLDGVKMERFFAYSGVGFPTKPAAQQDFLTYLSLMTERLVGPMPIDVDKVKFRDAPEGEWAGWDAEIDAQG